MELQGGGRARDSRGAAAIGLGPAPLPDWGHGDKRRVSEKAGPEIFCPTAGMRSIVCDVPDEVRRAVREQLRMGADQIKVMASGGAMSPADELWELHTQRDEIEKVFTPSGGEQPIS